MLRYENIEILNLLYGLIPILLLMVYYSKWKSNAFKIYDPVAIYLSTSAYVFTNSFVFITSDTSPSKYPIINKSPSRYHKFLTLELPLQRAIYLRLEAKTPEFS